MFGIVPWPPLLLCCLLCGQTMGLIWPLPALLSTGRSTPLAQPPCPSTAPAAGSCSVCAAWRGSGAVFVLAWQGQGLLVSCCSKGPVRRCRAGQQPHPAAAPSHPAAAPSLPCLQHHLARTSPVTGSSRAPACQGQSCRHKFGKLLSYEQSYEH